MTALNLILIVAGAMLAVVLLTVLAWLIHTWFLEQVELRLAVRKGLYRDLVSALGTRDRALLNPTIHRMDTLYDLDALEAVLEEQARNASGRPEWLLGIYDELGLVDKYIGRLRSARKWRDRAFAAELLGWVGGAKSVPALLETVAATRTEDSDVREVSLRALARIADPGAVEPLIRALAGAEAWLAPRIADILTRHGDAVVDPLIALLDDGGQPARAWAANVLGEVRAQRAFPVLVRLLADPEAEVRARAATALGRLDDGRAAGYLLDRLLTDPAPFVRVRIASALAHFGGPEVIDRLVRALGDPAWWVRIRSVEALQQIGAGAEGPLLLALDDTDPEIRVRAAVALEGLGVGDNLVRMIESGERVPEAHETLIKLAATGSREFLSELIMHPSRQIRAAALTAIGRAKRRDLADVVIKIAASDAEPSLRTLAFGTLGSLELREALPAAIAGVTDSDQRVRAAAVELVGKLGGSEVVEILRAQTSDPEAPVRAAAVRALGALAAAPAEPEVRALLGDPNSTVREAAVLAVAEARLLALVPSLAELLRDKDPGVRREAARSIGVTGDRSTVPALLNAFPDPAADVNEAIADAVSRLDLEAVPGLVESLAESSDLETKLRLIRTLSRSGSDSIPMLCRLAGDSMPAVRAVALEALGRGGRRFSDAVAPAVESALSDPEELVRATALDAYARGSFDQNGKNCTESANGIVGNGRKNRLLGWLKNDPSPLVRERAALAIGLLRIPEGEVALVAACRRTEPANVRAAAALAAGVFDHQSIVARIMEMPDQGVVRILLAEGVRRDARFRLLSLRLSGARQLEIRALKARDDGAAQDSLARGMRNLLDPEERIRLVGSLRSFQGDRSRDALIRTVLTDPNPEVRTAALGALGDLLEDEELLSMAARALGDPSVLVRRGAIALFGRTDPARALPRLIQSLKVDDEPAVLATAAGLVEEQFPAFAQAALALPLESEQVVLVTRIARHTMHSDLPRLLRPFARSASPEVRAAVADLWTNRPDTADPELLEALTLDPEVFVRRSAAAAAAVVQRYDLLNAMTRDPDSTVRREVAIVLGRTAPVGKPGLEILERLAGDTDMEVRAGAYVARLLQGVALPLPPELDGQLGAHALREIADLPRLRQTARTAPSEERRLAAALALALLQDDTARDVARTDPAPAIRHRVSGALDLSKLSTPEVSA